MTAEEFLQLPEGPPYCELIHGELIMAPSPDVYHQGVSGNVSLILREYLKKNPIGKIFFAPLDVKLDDSTVLQPDLMFISEHRKAILRQTHISGAPDLVVEILSPRTQSRDLGVKREIYARAGALEYWTIHPREQTISIFHLQAEPSRPRFTKPRGEDFTSPLFPHLIIHTEEIFAV